MNHTVGTAAEILRRDLDSASISDSILDYEFENGRRYHAYKAGSYPLPNDEVPHLSTSCLPLLSAVHLHSP